MKPIGTKFEYEKQRDDNLLRLFKQVLMKTKVINLPEIYREISLMPAERFWISEERAAIVISAMMKGEDFSGSRPNNQEMFAEIYHRAMELRARKPHLPICDIASAVVQQPAPRFYLTPGSIRIIIQRAKRKRLLACKERLKHMF